MTLQPWTVEVYDPEQIYFRNSLAVESGPWQWDPENRTISTGGYGERKVSPAFADRLNQALAEAVRSPQFIPYSEEDIPPDEEEA